MRRYVRSMARTVEEIRAEQRANRKKMNILISTVKQSGGCCRNSENAREESGTIQNSFQTPCSLPASSVYEFQLLEEFLQETPNFEFYVRKQFAKHRVSFARYVTL